MREFETYEAAAQFARSLASSTLCAYVQAPTAYQKWVAGYLPPKKDRYGWELRVEAIEAAR